MRPFFLAASCRIFCRLAHSEDYGIDREFACIAGNYTNRFRRAHQGISLEYYSLAATVKRHGCSLWTGNRKHDPMEDIPLLD
jgi:predicted nucleic acid-binding protein